MEQQEIKQKRGNLLDKFIRNERKAKLWAALSLVAFFSVATSVIVVAYQIKNEKNTDSQQFGNTKIDNNTRPDTVFISKEDPATATLINNQAETIVQLTDSLKELQVKYQLRLEDINRYIMLLERCENKTPGGDPPPPPPPSTELVSVIIYIVNFTNKIPDSSVEKLKKFIYYRDNSKNGMTINITETKVGIDPCVIYYDEKFADQANYIAKILNGSNAFSPGLKLSVRKDGIAKRVADIVIWPGNFR